MRKIAIILSVLAGTALLFSSCGKYEEGPGFSLLSKKARITGDWTITEITVNGVKEDISGSTLIYTLKKDGTGLLAYSYAGFNFSTPLEWEFGTSKETLKLREKDYDTEAWDSWYESEIIRLTNSELWLRESDTEGGIIYTTILKLEKK